MIVCINIILKLVSVENIYKGFSLLFERKTASGKKRTFPTCQNTSHHTHITHYLQTINFHKLYIFPPLSIDINTNQL